MPILNNPPAQNTPIKEVIDDRIAFAVERLNTCLPAKIVEFDNIKQVATVRPVVAEMYKDGVTKPFSDIVVVPVIFPTGGGGSITFPITKGDECLLWFSQRAFDTWLVTGDSPIKPTVQRYHNYNDAFAMVGLKSFKNSLKASTENVEIRMDDDNGNSLAKVVLQPDSVVRVENSDGNKITLKDGKFRIENNQEELLNVIKDLITACEQITTSTAINPAQPTNNKADFTALIARIENLRG